MEQGIMGGKITGTEGNRKMKSTRYAGGRIRERKWTDAKGKKHSCWQADAGTINGNRHMKSCPTLEKAEDWLQAQAQLVKDQGHGAYSLREHQRVDVMRALAELDKLNDADKAKDPAPPSCLSSLPKLSPLETVAKDYHEAWELLRDTGASLKDAARYFRSRRAPAIPRTVTEVIAEYVKDAKDNKLRERSVRAIEIECSKLAERFGTQLVTEIGRDDADKWLRSFSHLSASTQRHIRIIANGLYNFALDRDYTTLENPFAPRKHRRKMHEDEKMPACMPWSDAGKVLRYASENDESMVPALAIGFFAGLRTSEIGGLDWEQVDFNNKRITVLSTVAKKRRTRYVTMMDNLTAWLLPYRRKSGLVAPDGQKWRSRLDAIREGAKVKWPKNSMRHSFASHYYVMTNDAAKTAFELGHAGRDTQMLFEHYRSLVTTEDAQAYFEIRPTTKDNIIKLKQAN